MWSAIKDAVHSIQRINSRWIPESLCPVRMTGIYVSRSRTVKRTKINVFYIIIMFQMEEKTNWKSVATIEGYIN